MILYVLAATLIATAGLVLVGRQWALRRAARDRIREPLSGETPAVELEETDGPLRRWLRLAGFRSPAAPAWFIASTLALACLGPTLHQLFQLLDGLFQNRGGMP